MEDSIILNDQDRNRLLIMVVAFAIFLSGYAMYSVSKFKTVQARSLVSNNVVMKVIEHNVFSVCPKCGAKGVPLCPTCQVSMYWNGYRGAFVCPACGYSGFPQCPRCRTYMTWIESQ
ncbi:MAG: hypothetical protein HQL24_02910 [Candidatus Omnitrophica bacterium]|nr:hypothetical protein [Candidatus Omnitrophota bacterium]